MKRFDAATIVFILGFALSKIAANTCYLSAMGTLSASFGYVTTPAFMIANNACSALACAGAIVIGRRVRRVPCPVFVAAAFVLQAVNLLVAGNAHDLVLSGVLYGLAASVMSMAWIEACLGSRVDPAVALPEGFVLAALVQYLLQDVAFNEVASLSMLAASVACLVFLMGRQAPRPVSSAPAASRRAGASGLGSAIFCLMVCTFVVGMAHTAALDTDYASLFADVDMQLTQLVGRAIAALVIFCGAGAPDPVNVYKACLPVLFVVFSVMPILEADGGPIVGTVMIACWEAAAVLFAVFVVAFAKRHALEPRGTAGICIGSTNVSLLLGLLTGFGLNALSADQGLPLLVLVAFCAIYPLGMVFVLATRRRDRREEEPSARGKEAPDAAPARPQEVPEAAARSQEALPVAPPVAPSAVSSAASQAASQVASQAAPPASSATSPAAPVDVLAVAPAAGASVDSPAAPPAASVPVPAAAPFAAPAPASAAAAAPAPPAAPLADAAIEQRADELAKRYRLTEREREILPLLAQGRSGKRIAQELFVTENTVWSHVRNIYSKLGVHSKQEVIDLFNDPDA